MKQILFFSALWCALAFTSCGGGASEQTTDGAADTLSASQDSLAEATDSMVVDGISGATQVANAPSFNGILMVPPQRHATITLSMGGAVHSVSFLPGSYVQKGQVILTLEIRILSLCSRPGWTRPHRLSSWKKNMHARRTWLRMRQLPRNRCSRVNRSIFP